MTDKEKIVQHYLGVYDELRECYVGAFAFKADEEKCLSELKESVTQDILKSLGYRKPPDRPELLEDIAKFQYGNFNTISKGSWEDLPKFNEVRQWWLTKADQLPALYLPQDKPPVIQADPHGVDNPSDYNMGAQEMWEIWNEWYETNYGGE